MQNQINTQISHKTLLEHFNKIYPDEHADLSHLEHLLTEARRPLNSFGITLLPDSITIPSTLTIPQLNHHLDTITDATAFLDTIVESELADHQDLKSTYSLTHPFAFKYFTQFLEHGGDDTAFDYHASYTTDILEAIVEALSPR